MQCTSCVVITYSFCIYSIHLSGLTPIPRAQLLLYQFPILYLFNYGCQFSYLYHHWCGHLSSLLVYIYYIGYYFDFSWCHPIPQIQYYYLKFIFIFLFHPQYLHSLPYSFTIYVTVSLFYIQIKQVPSKLCRHNANCHSMYGMWLFSLPSTNISLDFLVLLFLLTIPWIIMSLTSAILYPLLTKLVYCLSQRALIFVRHQKNLDQVILGVTLIVYIDG